MASISSIPTELLLVISAELPLSSLAALSLTCRGFLNALTPSVHSAVRKLPEVLHWAARRGHAPLVRILLSYSGAGLSAKDHTELTPLIHAVVNGHAECVALLLEAGANPNGVYVRERGRARGAPLSLLYIAASAGDAAVSRCLASFGADLNGGGTAPSTPLFAAAKKGFVATVRTLLEVGADPNYGPKPALQIAIERNHLDVADTLLRAGAAIDQRDAKGATALSGAVFDGYEAGVLFLLARGARVDANSDGRNLLALVVRTARTMAVLRAVLAAPEVDVNSRPVLCLAAARGSADATRLLLAAGADPTVRNRDGRTPVLVAAAGGHADIVAQLVAAGADLGACVVDAAAASNRPVALLAAACNDLGVGLRLPAGADEAPLYRAGGEGLRESGAEGGTTEGGSESGTESGVGRLPAYDAVGAGVGVDYELPPDV